MGGPPQSLRDSSPLEGGSEESTPDPIPGADELRRQDAEALRRYGGVRSAHAYQASWYNNATFVFPLVAVIVAGIVWLATGSGEAGGAAIFFLVVTAAMLPVVFLTWQRTTTAIVVHDDGLTALHQGQEQQTIAWPELRSVRRMETMGNVRWYLDGQGEEHIVVEGEIAGREALLEAARRELADRRANQPPAGGPG